MQGFRALDMQGNIRTVTYAEAGQPPILYRYHPHHYRYFFVDPDHRAIAETDGHFMIRGAFVLMGERAPSESGYSMRVNPKAVYALDGRLLLDNVYGYIHETLGPNGGLFVYLDERTCVLLSPDGSTTPVPDAPVVELAFTGG